MKAKTFEEKNNARWCQFDAIVESAEKAAPDTVNIAQLPEMLQQQCADLALARYRMYGQNMCEHLNQQVIRGHKIVYKKTGRFWEKFFYFLAVQFPCAVRREWRLHLICGLVAIIPGLLAYWAIKEGRVEWARAILGESGMMGMDSMFGKDTDVVEKLRQEHGSNFEMFAHYINNNIGIAFQMFAGGVLFGIGTLFFLIYNSVAIGASAGYVEAYGNTEAFYGFVSSHASYELWGIVIASMAGMRMGLGLLLPGRKTRVHSAMEAGKKALPLICGSAVMIFIAACVEGFWSAQPVGFHTKVWVGAAGWLLIILYFSLAGRGHRYEA